MKRLSLLAPAALGALLLVSCDPYGPPPGYTGPTHYGYGPPYPPIPASGAPRGDGYNDPNARDGEGGYTSPSYGANDNGDVGSYDPDGRTAPPSRNPTPPPSSGKTEYPVAERTKNPNEVLSPYEPYNVIDVTGFKSGQRAKDPSNGKIFRVP